MEQPPLPDLSALPPARLQKMARAGEEALTCLRVLAKTSDNIVGEVLRGNGEFVEWEHYPPDDVFDPESRAQYYYHAHPPEQRQAREHGHFHLFLRREGMPAGMTPARLPPGETADAGERLSHLVAISMDRFGLPTGLFTTNRWVTGETWYAADDVVALLDRFTVDVARPNWLINRWITAMVALFQPQIAALVQARDAAVARWRADHPGTSTFEDRSLEVTARLDVSVEGQSRTVARALASVGRAGGL